MALMSKPPAGVLLERQREVAELTGAVETARAGSGRVVLVEGPAGIGKTRLLNATRELAREHGLLVLAGRGGELERDFPYGVVRQLFLSTLAFAPSERRVKLLEGAAALAVPAIGLEGSDPEAVAAPAARGDASFAVPHGLYWLCANLAGQTPVLISLDDAHWCDAASLRFLVYLIRRLEALPIAVVLAARTGEPDAEGLLLSSIAEDPLARVLRPAPLSEAAVAELVRLVLSPSADDEFCRACSAATAGNPFFLRELLTVVAEGGIAPVADRAQQVGALGPRSISRTVLARMARLPQAALALARALSVLGDGAELRHTCAVASVERAAGAEAVDALARAGIFEADLPLRFAHPIVRSAIYADLSPAARTAAHERAALMLSNDHAPSEKIAMHLLSVEPDERVWVVETLRGAAARALARGAPEAAVSYLHRATREPPPPACRAAVLRELGAAERRTGDAGAVQHLEQSLELANDPIEHAAAARELAGALGLVGRVHEAVGVLARAIPTVSEQDGELALQLEAELITLATIERSTWPLAEERLARFEGRVEGRTPAERLLLVALAHEAGRTGRAAAEAADLAERALDDGRLVTEQTADAPPFYIAVYVLIAADRLELAGRLLDQALADAQGRGSVLGFIASSCYRSHLGYRRGAIADAEADARTAFSLAVAHGWVAMPMALAYLIDALTERGDLAGAEEALTDAGMTASLPETTIFNALLSSRGRLRLAEGETESGLDDLLELVRREEEWRAPHPAATHYRTSAAVALAAVGREVEARRLVEREVASARRWGAPSVVGSALRGAGLVEGGEAGIELLREAAAILEPSPARLERARTLVDLGAALRRAGHRTAGREPLRQGLDLAHRCGASVLAQQARGELLITGARPRRPLVSGLDALTASERRVVQMAAQQMTNREIAQALFVTTRTVEVHLTHAYRKLGVRSREALPNALEGTA